MKKTITIGTESVECVVNAFTPVLYRQIFHKDFLAEIQTLTKLKAKSVDEYTEEDLEMASDRTMAMARMAFVMKEQASGKPIPVLVNLTEVNFFEWLSTFESDAFQDVKTLTMIMALWKANTQDNKIESKNE